MSKQILFALAIVCCFGSKPIRAAHPNLAEDSPARKAAVGWLKSHFKPTPGAKNILADVSKFPDERNLTLTLGPFWMKSGKPTQVCIFDGEFFSFELTRMQFEKLGIQNDDAQRSEGPQTDKISDNPIAKLSNLKVDKLRETPSGRSVVGSLTFKRERASADNPILILAFYDGKIRHMVNYIADSKTFPEDGTIHFEFTAGLGAPPMHFPARPGRPEPPVQKPQRGPVAIFVGLYTMTGNPLGPGGGLEYTLYSNVVATIIDVPEKDKPADADSGKQPAPSKL